MNNLFKRIVNICLFSQFDHNDTSNNKNEEFKNYEGYFSFIPNDLKGPPPISNIPSSSFNQTMDLRIEIFEDANDTSDYEEHLDSTHIVKAENHLSSSFNSDCYEKNKNHKSLDGELAEIEIEFQNNCSKDTFSINQI